MTGIIATCGHQVDSVYDLTTVRLKDTTRDGKPAVSYCEYCPACAERIKGVADFLPDDEAVDAWLGLPTTRSRISELKGEKDA